MLQTSVCLPPFFCKAICPPPHALLWWLAAAGYAQHCWVKSPIWHFLFFLAEQMTYSIFWIKNVNNWKVLWAPVRNGTSTSSTLYLDDSLNSSQLMLNLLVCQTCCWMILQWWHHHRDHHHHQTLCPAITTFDFEGEKQSPPCNFKKQRTIVQTTKTCVINNFNETFHLKWKMLFTCSTVVRGKWGGISLSQHQYDYHYTNPLDEIEKQSMTILSQTF